MHAHANKFLIALLNFQSDVVNGRPILFALLHASVLLKNCVNGTGNVSKFVSAVAVRLG